MPTLIVSSSVGGQTDFARLLQPASQRALVTGGSRGLGRSIARALLSAGLTVHITSRDSERVGAAVMELAADGDVRGHPAKLEQPNDIARLAGELAGLDPPLGILVNNAGTTSGAPLADYSMSKFRRTIEVDLTAPFELIARLAPELARAGSDAVPARVINIGSADGISVPGTENYAYSAAKAGLHHLTRHLAHRLAPSNITVNAIAPGLFNTRLTKFIIENDVSREDVLAQIPLGRFGTEQDIAGAVLFLASQAASYITGAVLVVDGGIASTKPWYTLKG